MTRSTNARLAGSAFLFYIAVGITDLILSGKATAGTGAEARLASIAQHAGLMRVTALLGLLQCVAAVVLGVTLYAITRDDDHDLAVLGMSFRLGEGFLNAMSTVATLALLTVATMPEVPTAVGGALLRVNERSFYVVGASLFAIGSTCFSLIFLRARSIPVWLARLGVGASLLLVVALPSQMLGLIRSPVSDVVWIPMAIFEVVLGGWLIVTGATRPNRGVRDGID